MGNSNPANQSYSREKIKVYLRAVALDTKQRQQAKQDIKDVRESAKKKLFVKSIWNSKEMSKLPLPETDCVKVKEYFFIHI